MGHGVWGVVAAGTEGTFMLASLARANALRISSRDSMVLSNSASRACSCSTST